MRAVPRPPVSALDSTRRSAIGCSFDQPADYTSVTEPFLRRQGETSVVAIGLIGHRSLPSRRPFLGTWPTESSVLPLVTERIAPPLDHPLPPPPKPPRKVAVPADTLSHRNPVDFRLPAAAHRRRFFNSRHRPTSNSIQVPI